jgi:hypothetical protein
MIVTMPVSERAEPESISSDAGMKNDFNEEHPRNACCSIRFSFDRDSKVNDESDSQKPNDPWQMISTDAGIQMNCNDEQMRNEPASI